MHNYTTQQTEIQKGFEAQYRARTYPYSGTKQFSEVLAVKIGLNEAIFLDKLIRLTTSSKNKNLREGFYWFFNSYPSWQKEYFPWWAERTIRRIVNSLISVGLIEVTNKHNKARSFKDNTYWYRVRFDVLHELLHGKQDFQLSSDRIKAVSQWADSDKVATSCGQIGRTVESSPLEHVAKMDAPLPPPPTTPPENLGGSVSKENHEGRKVVSESKAVPTVPVLGKETDPYAALTWQQVYDLAVELNVAPEEIEDAGEYVNRELLAGNLRVRDNMVNSTRRIVSNRLVKGYTQPANEIGQMDIQRYEPKARMKSEVWLAVARAKEYLEYLKTDLANGDVEKVAKDKKVLRHCQKELFNLSENPWFTSLQDTNPKLYEAALYWKSFFEKQMAKVR